MSPPGTSRSNLAATNQKWQSQKRNAQEHREN